MLPPPPRSTLFPYTTLFRSAGRDLHGLHGKALTVAVQFEIQVRTVRQKLAQHRRLNSVRGAFRLDDEAVRRSEEHTSELQSLTNLVCRLLLEKKKKKK